MQEQIVAHALTSNGYVLAAEPQRMGRLAASDPATPITALREQFRAQGYLWLRNLLDRESVLAFRGRVFTALAATGLVSLDHDAVTGIYAGADEDRLQTRRITTEIVKWAAYESFCLSQPIWQFYEQFLGGPVYLHKRKLIRVTRPGDPNCTGAHYDLTYLRAGTDRVCTSWIPIGDIPVEMGGLIYLEGSDAFGRQAEAEFSAKNADLSPEERISAYNRNMTETGWLTKDLPSLAERLNSRWLVADYMAGDMVIHSAYMIHAATVNESTIGTLRLSTDIRYQLVADEIDPRWGEHWAPDDAL